MSLCSVLRKVAAGTYIGGYLFRMVTEWNRHYCAVISTHKSYFWYGEVDSRDDVIHLLDS